MPNSSRQLAVYIKDMNGPVTTFSSGPGRNHPASPQLTQTLPCTVLGEESLGGCCGLGENARVVKLP